MNHKLLLPVLIFIIAITFACKEEKKEVVKDTNIYPYQFIDTKIEDVGDNKNQMDLYWYDGKIDKDELVEFFKSKKPGMMIRFFSYIVIFDKKENAAFPKDPFTARYGLETNKLKHIRAIYEYNSRNGFSELSIYKKSSWDSPAETIKI